MKLTIDILLYFTSDRNPVIFRKAEGTRYVHGVKYLTSEIHDFQHGFLYVCDRENYLVCRERLPRDVFVIVVSEESEEETPLEGNSPCGMVLVRNGDCIEEVLNRLLDSYYMLTEWDKDMHIAALEGRSVQELFDISEKVMKFPMIAYDASFNVVAYTKNIPCDDAEFKKTIKNGYTDVETMEKLKKKQIFSKIKKNNMLIAPAADSGQNISIYMQYFDGSALLGYCNIFCGNTRPEQGYLDLVDLFMDNMSFCYKRDYENQRYGRMMYDTFFSNLIHTGNLSDERIDAQFRLMEELKDTGRYLLGILYFGSRENIPLPFLARMLERQFWNVKPFIYEDSICLFKSLEKPCPEHYFLERGEFDKLDKLLENYDYTLGVGNSFSHLRYLKDAYRQARIALEFGCSEKKQNRIRFYQDYCYYHLFSLAEPQMDVAQIQSEFYQNISAYDKEHETGYREMFLCYLKNDCSATRTAGEMGLHRNTIRNMIHFLENHFEISVSDQDLKARFILSDQVREYMEFKKQGEQ